MRPFRQHEAVRDAARCMFVNHMVDHVTLGRRHRYATEACEHSRWHVSSSAAHRCATGSYSATALCTPGVRQADGTGTRPDRRQRKATERPEVVRTAFGAWILRPPFKSSRGSASWERSVCSEPVPLLLLLRRRASSMRQSLDLETRTRPTTGFRKTPGRTSGGGTAAIGGGFPAGWQNASPGAGPRRSGHTASKEDELPVRNGRFPSAPLTTPLFRAPSTRC